MIENFSVSEILENFHQLYFAWTGIEVTFKSFCLMLSVALTIAITLFIMLIAALCNFVAYLWIKRQNKRIEFVKTTSERYKALLKINEMFQFHNELSQESLIFFECSSKQQYDHFQPNNHMLNYICEKSDLFSVIIRMAEENQENFALYTEAIRNLPPAVSEKEAALKKYKYKRYAKIETKLVEDAYLTPVLYPDYFLEYSYRSPQGRNFYHNTVRFYFGKIQDLYEQALHLEKSKQSREYQRSLMTPKLRYEIMTRDGHRCVICGRDASDGVKLHVDHIVPVSKGGMTVASNLRTLCEECNLGKGARYDEDGIN